MTCLCRPWKRDRFGGYERTCLVRKAGRVVRRLASLVVWGGNVSVHLIETHPHRADEHSETRFPHLGPAVRLDEAKAYANSELAPWCQRASEYGGSLSGRGRRG